MSKNRKAILALEDGSVFVGRAFGASKTVVGEVVFNTSMMGYQEVLTDPSYFGQIVAMTTVEIGNYGINDEDNESDSAKLAGFVVREVSPIASSWRSTMTIQEFLERQGVPAISGVDTRAITTKIRDAGMMKACLSTEDISEQEAIERAKNFSGLKGSDFVKELTCKQVYKFDDSQVVPFTVEGTNLKLAERPEKLLKCAVIDFGAKKSLLIKLANSGFDLTVYPATTSVEDIKKDKPNCIFLSNGAGDPSTADYAHKTVAELMKEYPVFGVDFGMQIIACAMGAKTYKLKTGHHGGNQPVRNIEAGLVSITAQNHCFAVEAQSLEQSGGIITEINLNDNSVAGFRHKDLSVFGVQFIPDSGNDTHECTKYFKHFYDIVSKKS